MITIIVHILLRADAALGRLADRLGVWRERAGERRRLAGLDERMRRDLGLSAGQIDGEARKPCWRR